MGKIAKFKRGDYKEAALQEKLIAELGDVLWAVAACSHELGFTLRQVAHRNLSKLKSRKERGKLKGDGDDR